MHELSIAISVVEIVQEEAALHQVTCVEAVRVRIGPMSGVSRQALAFSYQIAAEGTAAEGSRLVFEDGPGAELEIVALEVEEGSV